MSRLAAALVVLALHLALIVVLRPSAVTLQPRPVAASITWIDIPPPRPAPEVETAPPVPSKTPPRPRVAPPPSSNAITLPPPDSARDALNAYVMCGIATDKQPPEQRERCAKLRAGLHPDIPMRTVPTAAELAAERRFGNKNWLGLELKPMCEPPIQNGKICDPAQASKPGYIPGAPPF